MHPWLDWYFPGERLDTRIRSSPEYRRAWVVGHRFSRPPSGTLGPYRISPPPN